MMGVTPLLQRRKDATAASCNSHLDTVEAASGAINAEFANV